MHFNDVISVIIPAFNAELFIASAIESIRSQEYGCLDIVVVDDGSTDRTAEVVASFGDAVRLIRQQNGGPPSARNRGLAASSGNFIAFLDADDLYEPGCLRLQMDKLKRTPGAQVCTGQVRTEQLCSAAGEPPSFMPVASSDKQRASLGASLFRRAAFDLVGSFDEALRHCDDWDWFMRARELGVPLLFHGETVLCVRLHLDNLTRNREDGNRYLALMMKRSIERRRLAHGEAKTLPPLADALPSVGDPS